MKKKILATTAFLALALSGCAATAEARTDNASAVQSLGNSAPEGQIDPALWKMSDEDTTIYILGTFHLLPEDFDWRTETIDTALAASDEIYFEIEDDLSNPAAVAPVIQSMAMDPTQPSLVERVGEEEAARVAELLSGMGLPPQALDMMDTWFVGLNLASALAMKAGATPGAGVEIDLRKTAEARGLPIGGLETLREQLGQFDTLSADAQRSFLTGSLEDEAVLVEMFNSMRDAWVRGDADGISEYFNDDMEMGTEIRTALLTERNADWTGDLVTRMGEPGTVFVAVGAGHLVGDDSVIAMLREQGYTVERIDD